MDAWTVDLEDKTKLRSLHGIFFVATNHTDVNGDQTSTASSSTPAGG